MQLLNKLGEELVKRKRVLLEEPKSSLSYEDTIYIIENRYYNNKVINDEIKNAIVNNNVLIPEFEKILLNYTNFRKDENQIKQELALLAEKLEEEIKLQELPISKKDMRLGNNLTTINIQKTICLTQDFMKRYIGLENDINMYEKVINKCIIPFFIFRVKKIIDDIAKSESLKSNYMRVTSSRPYQYNSGSQADEASVMFNFVIEIDISLLESNNGYNEAANYIRIALDYFNTYYEARILE